MKKEKREDGVVMRRGLVYFLAATLLLSVGCTQTAAPPLETPAPTPTVMETPTPTPTPTPEAKPQEIPQNYENIGEETYSYQYKNVEVEIKSPYLCGPAEDKELNDLLRQEALGNRLTGDESDVRRGIGYVMGNWEMMRNDARLLSICFRQDYGAGGPNGISRWGVTLDLEDKKRLALADIVDTGDDFEVWLYAQDWTVQEQWIGGGDEIGKDREYVEHLLPLYMEWSADPAEEIQHFYITDTNLFLIVWEGKYDTHLSVPLSDLTLKGGDLWNV